MDETMDRLIRALDLEKLEENLYRGVSSSVGWQRTFGGEVIAQALVAAQRTVVPERPVHSLHGYFLRPGNPKAPVIYEVSRIRDGGSFTTRIVHGIQHGEAIFTLSASFQRQEDGLDHQMPMPDVPARTTCPPPPISPPRSWRGRPSRSAATGAGRARSSSGRSRSTTI